MRSKKKVLVVSTDPQVTTALDAASYEGHSVATFDELGELTEPFDCAVVEAWFKGGNAAAASQLLRANNITGRVITIMRSGTVSAVVLGQVVAQGSLPAVVTDAVALVLGPHADEAPESSVRPISSRRPGERRSSSSG